MLSVLKFIGLWFVIGTVLAALYLAFFGIEGYRSSGWIVGPVSLAITFQWWRSRRKRTTQSSN